MLISCILQDSREVSKLIGVWETVSQPPAQTAWTTIDKLRKSATDLVETESEYVMVIKKHNCHGLYLLELAIHSITES